MNKLWIRLTLSHTALALLAISIVLAVTWAVLDVNVRRYAARRLADTAGILERIPELAAVAEKESTGATEAGAAEGPELIVADSRGLVVYNRGGRYGRFLTPLERQVAVPIFAEGELVAYVLPVWSASLTGEFAALFELQQRTLGISAAVAVLAALLTGRYLSKSISAPLRRLAGAAGEIAQGNLSQQIVPSGPDEIRDLAIAFNRMAADLSAAEESRRAMVADIAHELRTPLAVLQGNLSAMLDGVFDPSEQELAALYDEVLRLSRLVQDLAQLAELDSRQLGLSIVPTDMAWLLEQAITLFQVAAEEKGVRLEGHWPADMPLVAADGSRLGQVLHNLLSNALRHSHTGGRIAVGARAGPTGAELWVADDGDGIAPADLPRIFERFWRADHSRSRESGGSGLGLSIAKQLVEAMGGTISVESTPHSNTRFTVHLPLASQNHSPATPK